MCCSQRNLRAETKEHPGFKQKFHDSEVLKIALSPFVKLYRLRTADHFSFKGAVVEKKPLAKRCQTFFFFLKKKGALVIFFQ